MKVPEIINKSEKLSYLALGDSYTIGESVPLASSFPYQLSACLSAKGLDISAPVIIAKTGWTTGELQSAIEAANLNDKFNLVTLLIGVNNQYRGESLTVYKAEFEALLQTAIDFANGKRSAVFVLSIPDWSNTPFGKNSDRDHQTTSTEIDKFNAVNREVTAEAGVHYTDITHASKRAFSDPKLVAIDGLHYSESMHAQWAASLMPSILKVFKLI